MVVASLVLFAPRFHAYKHPVMTWVPPYGVAQSETQLVADYGGVGMKDGLTHLGLQFWVPTKDGDVARSGGIADMTVIRFRDWAHRNGIRALLCVFNGEHGWDWSLARAAFEKPVFVENLVNEVQRMGLDGVDVDLEGPGEFEADKPTYLAFIKALSKEMKARKMHLTVDTFSAMKWNTPNQSWWPEIFPMVTAITTMGYDDSGLKATEWRGYPAQKKVAAKHASKLLLGFPGFKDSWQGNSVTEQLAWAEKHKMGLGIWDAQLSAKGWQSAEVWQTIAKIRG